jgi:pyridoxamine 5'-phosphate oxidase
MTTDPITELASRLPGVPGRDGYFPLMSLATIDLDGGPDVRTVLLSEITAQGLTFHTDVNSRKVTQVRADPSVALLLTIPEQAQQIVVRGTAASLDGPEVHAAYRNRSRYLQLLAWMNTAEMSALPEDERHRRWAEFSEAHPDGTLEPPTEWAGFLVRPHRITFWQADTRGPSHRIEYTRSGPDWSGAHHPG